MRPILRSTDTIFSEAIFLISGYTRGRFLVSVFFIYCSIFFVSAETYGRDCLWVVCTEVFRWGGWIETVILGILSTLSAARLAFSSSVIPTLPKV